MPRPKENELTDHPIFTYLYQAGFTRKGIADQLHINIATFHKVRKDPLKHLCISNIETISSMLNKPFIEVIQIIRGYKLEEAKKWYLKE